MTTLDSVCQSLARIAPLKLAESWDNVGLLVGDRTRPMSRIMTCLTVSPPVVDEAVEESADLIVTHHPLPFKPVGRITSDTIVGAMLLRLIGAGTAVYSAHTAFDSSAVGINQSWADMLGLQLIQPLVEFEESDSPEVDGSGRMGTLAQPETLHELLRRAADASGATAPRCVGDLDREVSKIALACGSGGSFLAAAKRRGCDAMITGEATFHTCLEAESLGVALGLLGHYASERFAMERLANELAEEHAALTVWPSRRERDPIVGL